MTKRYGATVALNDVTFEVETGSVHALIGENGAGKSTLVKVVNGVVRPDDGEVEIFGEPARLHGPPDAAKRGIATAYQEISLVPDMTVAENLFLGAEPRRFGFISNSVLRRRAADLLERLEIYRLHPDWLAGDLTLPEKQMCEIAKTLRLRPRLVFLDEPTSALGEGAMEWFYGLVNRLREDGVTVIFITHRLAETREIADRITILRNGHDVGTYGITELPEAEVIRLMIGRSLHAAFPPRRPAVERETGLEVRGLTLRGALDRVSFSLGRGEILGVGGLEGQGQRELFLTLFGVIRSDAGEILIDGRPVKIRSPQDAIDTGIGISLVPEDRKTEGLFLKLPIRDNIALPVYGRFATLGWIHNGLTRREVRKAAEKVNLDPKLGRQDAGSLSGGNQQKVVIAKWVLAGSRYLLLYDPTRGVDVGTKFEIYTLMQELAEEGVSIIFYSSELPEVLNMSDRVLVFYRSRIVGEFRGEKQTEERVMAAALGQQGVAA